ncbi:MAG: pilin [bacterium]|nr:pilin [bacterium]
MRKFLTLFFGFFAPLGVRALDVDAPDPSLIPSTDIESICDFYEIIQAATSWILVFGLLIGVLFVIWGGVKYITSGGDDTKAKDAKNIILYAIIGTVFLVLATALIKIIASFFGADLDVSLEGSGFFSGSSC